MPVANHALTSLQLKLPAFPLRFAAGVTEEKAFNHH